MVYPCCLPPPPHRISPSRSCGVPVQCSSAVARPPSFQILRATFVLPQSSHTIFTSIYFPYLISFRLFHFHCINVKGRWVFYIVKHRLLRYMYIVYIHFMNHHSLNCTLILTINFLLVVPLHEMYYVMSGCLASILCGASTFLGLNLLAILSCERKHLVILTNKSLNFWATWLICSWRLELLWLHVCRLFYAACSLVHDWNDLGPHDSADYFAFSYTTRN